MSIGVVAIMNVKLKYMKDFEVKEHGNNANTLLCDVANVMLQNKIKLIKEKIEQLADKHEYYMGISQGDGSMATEIIEQKQSKLWALLDKLQGNIT